VLAMPKIYVTDRRGAEHAIDATNGFTLMEAIRDEGDFELAAICGGMMSCSTCHVYVDAAWEASLPAPTRDERELLEESSHNKSNSRLSCQIEIKPELTGLRVWVAPED
jgi:2Fe-2S ferredoxin